MTTRGIPILNCKKQAFLHKVVLPVAFSSIVILQCNAYVPSNVMASRQVPKLFETIVLKALKRQICALNFEPIQY